MRADRPELLDQPNTLPEWRLTTVGFSLASAIRRLSVTASTENRVDKARPFASTRGRPMFRGVPECDAAAITERFEN